MHRRKSPPHGWRHGAPTCPANVLGQACVVSRETRCVRRLRL